MSEVVTFKEVLDAMQSAFSIDTFKLFFLSRTGKQLEVVTNPDAALPDLIAGALNWQRQQTDDWFPLFEKAALERPDHPILSDVYARLLEQRGRAFDPRLVHALERTLRESGIQPQSLLAAFRMFAPQRPSSTIDDSAECDLAENVIEKIVNLLDNGMYHPLFCILLCLKLRHPASNASRLLGIWIDDAKNKGLLSPSENRKAKAAVDEAIEKYRNVRVHLLIVLTPPQEKETEYTVSAWRQAIHEGKVYPMVAVDGLPTRCRESDLETVVNDIIQRVERQMARIAAELEKQHPDRPVIAPRMVIELFLPLRLLAAPADQWLLRFAEPVALGVRHWIVVRSWERAYDPAREFEDARWNWRRFWDFRRKNAKGLWADQPLFEEKKYMQYLESNDGWAVALRFVPAEEQWGKVVRTGTPVALWIRDTFDARFQNFVDGILEEGLQWLERVSEARRKNGETHVQRLTLLWDEPDLNRLPPNAIDNIGFESPEGTHE